MRLAAAISAILRRRMALLLFECLEIGDDVVNVVSAAESAEWHSIAGDFCLRVFDVSAQVCFIPGQIGAFHGVRIAEVIAFGGFSPKHASEAWTDRVGLLGMASHARLKQCLSVLGVGSNRLFSDSANNDDCEERNRSHWPK